jgi:hypothetical protein
LVTRPRPKYSEHLVAGCGIANLSGAEWTGEDVHFTSLRPAVLGTVSERSAQRDVQDAVRVVISGSNGACVIPRVCRIQACRGFVRKDDLRWR